MASSVHWPNERFPADGNSLSSPVVRVHYQEPVASRRLAEAIRFSLLEMGLARQPWTVVCVGTDRSTGDALGPLVGDYLRRYAPPQLRVFGTLELPVHATNLVEVLGHLEEASGHAVIAVDACLGQASHVGTVSLRLGPLHPGTGVNKNLPPVGDIHLVGVVNVGGFMEYFVLQNTRLHLVARMAEVIGMALLEAAGVGFEGSWAGAERGEPSLSGSVRSLPGVATLEAAGGQDLAWPGSVPPRQSAGTP
ncbi:MAG: spore protease YyaC [Limnochordaceae bacterium]|nr:spore protease YyaC [Limnochordaceae bacterium]